MAKQQGKNIKQKAATKKQSAKTKKPALLQDQPAMLSDKQLWIATLAMAILYFILSKMGNGFYQHDEAAHFLNMRAFWEDPSAIMSNWAKPGYKLLFVLPALAGVGFVQILNCAVAALTCYFGYKIAEKLGSKSPVLVFALIGMQTLWMMLSFRNYAEVMSAFMLVLGIFLHLDKKYILAALVASYLTFTRQEMFAVAGLYFLYLAFNKKFIAAAVIGVFPLIMNFWGYFNTGNILYLWDFIFGYAKKIGGGQAYPYHGFDQYFYMSEVIYGAFTVTLLSLYIGLRAMQKKALDWIVFVPAALIFVMFCLFNAAWFQFGPTTAGNLRYVVMVGPLFGILATLAYEEIYYLKDKKKLLIFLVPLLILVAAYMTFEHNWIELQNGKSLPNSTQNRPLVPDWTPLGLFLIVAVIIMLPIKRKQFAIAVTVAAILFGLVRLEHKKLTPEEITVKELAAWFQGEMDRGDKQGSTDPMVISSSTQHAANHAIFWYFLGKNQLEFEKETLYMKKEEIERLEKGGLVIWESHYSYRPKLRPTSPRHTYFLEKPKEYKLLKQLQSTDKRFTALVFQKLVGPQ